MKILQYRCTLCTDVILNVKSATEENNYHDQHGCGLYENLQQVVIHEVSLYYFSSFVKC